MTLGGSWTVTGSRLVLERSDPATDESSQAFEDFYSEEYAAVVGLAYALSGSRSGAEDLAQEAFLAAHRNWQRIGRYERPGAWVRRVVANLSVSAFRRRLAEAKAIARVALGSVPALPALADDDAEVWRMVRTLPRRQREVIALHYVDDMSVRDIARTLDMAEGTVKRHLHDGRVALAHRLESEDDAQ